MLSDLSWVAVCLLWPLIKRKVCVPFDMTPNALEILHQTLNHSSKSPWWQNTGFSSLSLQWQKIVRFPQKRKFEVSTKNCEVSAKEKMQGCSTFGEALGKWNAALWSRTFCIFNSGEMHLSCKEGQLCCKCKSSLT